MKWTKSKPKTIWGIPVYEEDTPLTRQIPFLVLPRSAPRMKPTQNSVNVGTAPPCLSGETEPDDDGEDGETYENRDFDHEAAIHDDFYRDLYGRPRIWSDD